MPPAKGGAPEDDADRKGTLLLPTLDDQLDSIGFGRFQWVALTAFVLFIIADGMELVVTNIVWRALPMSHWGMSDDMRGVFVSASFFGFVAGALVGGALGDTYGRQSIIYMHCMIFIPASISSALSGSWMQLLITRLLVGIAMGMALPSCVSMMAEITPAKYRGRAVIAIPGLAYATGQVLVLCCGILLVDTFGETCESGGSQWTFRPKCDWWRPMMAAGVIPNILGILLVLFHVPESPRFLLYQGKMDGVQKFCRRVADTNGAKDKLLNDGAVQPLDPDEIQDVRVTTQFVEVFSPSMRRIFIFVLLSWCWLAVGVFSQSFGYPIVLERDAELGFHDQYVLLLHLAAIEIPGIIFVIWMLENPSIGRKNAVIIFSAIAPLFAFLAIVLEEVGLIWFHLANIGLRIAAIVPYQVMYVYAAELFPTSHRNFGLSFGNAMTKTVGVALPILLMPLLTIWSGWIYVVIGFSGLMAAVSVFILGVDPSLQLPDTPLSAAKDASEREDERRYLLEKTPRRSSSSRATDVV